MEKKFAILFFSLLATLPLTVIFGAFIGLNEIYLSLVSEYVLFCVLILVGLGIYIRGKTMVDCIAKYGCIALGFSVDVFICVLFCFLSDAYQYNYTEGLQKLFLYPTLYVIVIIFSTAVGSIFALYAYQESKRWTETCYHIGIFGFLFFLVGSIGLPEQASPICFWLSKASASLSGLCGVIDMLLSLSLFADVKAKI